MRGKGKCFIVGWAAQAVGQPVVYRTIYGPCPSDVIIPEDGQIPMTLLTDLQRSFSPQQILARPIDRLAYASNASYYYLIPQVVVRPRTLADVRTLFQLSHKHRIPMTFRAAGTSLCGQSVTDGILVDISKDWHAWQIEDEARLLRAQPGLVGGYLNAVLKPYGRRIGPDPASIDACMLGGILANNSSGMCCGVAENSYHTLHSLTFVLPNGFCLNSADPDAHRIFENEQPDLARGLLEIRRQILEDAALTERIRQHYQMKNTNGYSLNAFVDFERPLDILIHLLIGSEGTLAFIAEAVLHTLPDYPRKYTAQLYFRTIQEAAAAVFPLRESGARAIEIMDRMSLRSVEHLPGVPSILGELPEEAAAVLVEYQATDGESLSAFRRAADRTLRHLPLLHQAEFTEDPAQQTVLWKARKGMFASVSALRPPGTTCLLEDVVFPVPRLAEAVLDLRALFSAHGYDDAIIFGHAKDGNLHFTITESFATEDDLNRFDRFTRDLVRLVVEKYDGALKGEHGAGRSMAPFIEAEWGPKALNLMRQIKDLFDPDHLLNPGVILTDDPQAHVSFTKQLPRTDPRLDLCIECGFCEPHCPSRRLTLTPRQRIVLLRALTRLHDSDQTPAWSFQVTRQAFAELDRDRLLADLDQDWQYAGLATCATDGLCGLACPVGINTGQIVLSWRAQRVTPWAERLGLWVARHFRTVERLVSQVVALGHRLDRWTNRTWRRAWNGPAARLRLPLWRDFIPSPAVLPVSPNGSLPADAETFIYFPSCVSRALGRAEENLPSLAETLIEVAHRAGVRLVIPSDVVGLCCGQVFESRGLTSAQEWMSQQFAAAVRRWTQDGRYSLVIDTTSCTGALCLPKGQGSPLSLEGVRILDGIEFLHDVVLPRLSLRKTLDRVVLHPNCSARRLGLQEKMRSVAQSCAVEVTVPVHLGCCGMAGDRGLRYPELAQAATEFEAREVNQRTYQGYYSNNLPCEINLSQIIGHRYLNLVYLVEQASRAGQSPSHP